MTRLTRILALCLTTLLPAAAQAGDWQALDGDGRTTCNLGFSGPIRNGDLMRGLEAGMFTDYLNLVCLDSPGGSLGEVHRFLQAAEGNIVFATRIRSGAGCLSSCAILFMFGQTFGANSPYPRREMEPGARLGFHSPFINDNVAVDVPDAEVFRVALDVAKLLADGSYKALTTAGPALPQELLALVLGTPSAGMRHVTSVTELRLLGVDLDPPPERAALFPDTRAELERLARQICVTSHTLTYRQHFVGEGYAFDDLVKRATDPILLGSETIVEAAQMTPANGYQPETYMALVTGPFFQPGWYSAGSMQYCRVAIGREKVPGGVRVPTYDVEFGYLGQLDRRDRVPAQGQGHVVRGFRAGLLPIDTEYGG